MRGSGVCLRLYAATRDHRAGQFCWDTESRKNSRSHIDASHSRQPLVKGERLVRYEVNAVMKAFAIERTMCPNSNLNLMQKSLFIPRCPSLACRRTVGVSKLLAPRSGNIVLKTNHACGSCHKQALLGRGPHKNCKNDLDDQT